MSAKIPDGSETSREKFMDTEAPPAMKMSELKDKALALSLPYENTQLGDILGSTSQGPASSIPETKLCSGLLSARKV